MTTIKTLMLTGLLAAGLTPAAAAQVQSFSTPPQGSVWNTMASVILVEARETTGQRFVVQPYGGNAQMIQAVNDALAEYSLNDVTLLALNLDGAFKDYPGVEYHRPAPAGLGRD